jgi:DNA repair protein SbcD/Mre11
MIKFGHLADVHIDKRQFHGEARRARREDIRSAWLWSCEYIARDDVDFVLISGDLFDNAVTREYGRSVGREGLQILQDALIPVYAVWGNHDGPDLTDGLSLLHELDDLEYLYVLDGEPVVFDEYVIHGVPWAGAASGRALLAITPDLQPDKFNVVMAHCGIEGLMPLNSPETVPMDVFSRLREQGVGYFALGHVHKPYSDGFVEMPGSLEALTRQEAKWNTRGFNIVTVYSNKSVGVEKITPPCRPYLAVDVHASGVQTVALLDGLLDEALFSIVDLPGLPLDPVISIKVTGLADEPIDTAGIAQQIKMDYPALHVEVLDATTRSELELGKLRADSSLKELEVEIFTELLGDETALAIEARDLALRPDATAEDLAQLFMGGSHA